MTIRIEPARPDGEEAMALIAELDAHLGARGYPVDSRHGYSVAKLLEQNVAFFVTTCEGEPAGCGGVQLFGEDYAELKRMYVRPAFRGRGLGKAMLQHLAECAWVHGARLLRLETGRYEDAAIGLYESFGFRARGPFGSYLDDPYSRYYEKALD